MGKSLSAPVPSECCLQSAPSQALCSQLLPVAWSPASAAHLEQRTFCHLQGAKLLPNPQGSRDKAALFGLGRGMLSTVYTCTWGMNSAGKSKSTVWIWPTGTGAADQSARFRGYSLQRWKRVQCLGSFSQNLPSMPGHHCGAHSSKAAPAQILLHLSQAQRSECATVPVPCSPIALLLGVRKGIWSCAMALLGVPGEMKGATAVVLTGCHCPHGAKDVTAAARTGELPSRKGLAWGRGR